MSTMRFRVAAKRAYIYDSSYRVHRPKRDDTKKGLSLISWYITIVYIDWVNATRWFSWSGLTKYTNTARDDAPRNRQWF